MEEFSKTITTALEPTLIQVNSTIRSALIDLIATPQHQPPTKNTENMIINSLITEYLNYNCLNHSKAVFEKEAKSDLLTRNQIKQKLKITGGDGLPLIYSLCLRGLFDKDGEENGGGLGVEDETVVQF